jgi:hypothetical protein
MADFMNDPISDVVKAILEDGVIDDAEVTQLRQRLYADGVIDQEEANALFEINDAVKGKANSAEWAKLFAGAVCDYLLKDETSPGEVDEEEAAWLIEKLEGDGEIDANEKVLLLTLKENAKKLADNLRAKLKDWGV